MKKRMSAMICVLVLLSMLTVFTVACNKDGFKINFYDGDSIVTSISTKGKEAITLPTDPVKAGYTFEGWFFEEEFINQLLSTTYEKTKLKAEVNVYAKWTAIDNTVAFNANGGTGEMASIVAKTDAVVKLTANAFAKDGYTFAGWATTATGEVAYADGADFKMTASGATLYAVWTVFTYTVNFNYDGAGSDTSVQTMQTTYDTAFTCPVPTKADNVFQGWYNGETQITDNLGASLVKFKDENGKVFNFKAKWALQTEGMTFTEKANAVTLERYKGNAQYVVIPDTFNGKPVTNIERAAFFGCSELKSITIPANVETIDSIAFGSCPKLTSVMIAKNSKLTSISERAFINSGLKEFTLPASVTTLVDNKNGYHAFMGSNIEKFIVEDGNPTFYVDGNCLINRSTQTLIAGCKDSTIPDGVTSIGTGAFQGYSRLTKVTIPSSVTSIGSYAFFECTGLISITIPTTVTSIGEMAFSGCSGLTSITVDKGNITYKSAGNCLIDIATKTLIAGCKSSVIPTDGSVVTSIGNGAFYEIELTSITIPNNVTSIGNSAFKYCFNLTSITISSSVISIGESAFYYCKRLTSITIPASVTSIGESAFYSCKGLTTITIPASVTSIGNSAFSNCSGLTSITIPASVTTVGERVFDYCTNLTTINCEVANPTPEAQPAGWDANWKGSCTATVNWGHTGA